MQAKLLIYKFNSGACEVEFINSLEEAFLILREQSAWPMLLDLAFEPALGSTIFSDLEKLPTLPYVSESIYSANLPENCRVWEKFGLINITKVYPVLKILGHRLLNAEDVITADLHEEVGPLGLASHEEQETPNYYLDQFEFSVRTSNVFEEYNISTIEDLLQYSEKQILSLPNFGRKSLNEIKTFLKIYDLQLGQGDLKFGPPIKLNSPELKKKSAGENSEINELSNIIADFERALETLSDRDREVMERRSGFNGRSETLEEIGNDLSVTRERVRQIEKRSINKLTASYSFWNANNIWGQALNNMFEKASYPLTIDYIQALNPQFSLGVHSSDVLVYITHKLLPYEFYSASLGDDICILREKSEILEEVNDIALDFSSRSEGKRVKNIFEQIKYLVPPTLSEFVQTICNNSLENSSITRKEGEDYLALFSRRKSALNIGFSIIENSPAPLTNKEVALRIEKEFPGTEVRNVLNRFQEIPGLFPFAHGIWGTIKHLELTDTEIISAQTIIKAAIREEPSEQFHSDVIFKTIEQRDPILAKKLDAFKVAGLIREYSTVNYLGRSMFTKSEKSIASRIKLHDCIVRVLRDAGEPMHTADIEREVRKIRSFSSSVFQVQIKPPIVSLGSGLFALDTLEYKKLDGQICFISQKSGEEKTIKTKRIWSSENLDLLVALRKKGNTYRQIAGIIGCSEQTASKKFKEITGSI